MRKVIDALYEYLEDLYDSMGNEEYELDVIALCCEYTEYENLEEFCDNYGDDYSTIDSIRDQTTVIMIDADRFIIQDF